MESALYVGNWMPALGVRPLRTSDLFGIVADTGQPKTATLLNILAQNSHLPALVFVLELAEDSISSAWPGFRSESRRKRSRRSIAHANALSSEKPGASGSCLCAPTR
jgi:hypothetical protein